MEVNRVVLAGTVRKMSVRVMILPFLLGLVSIIDRTNIGFAALGMNKDIGLTATTFGFGAGILFFGYFLFEVPSNLALARFGARKWLARIAVSWGIVAALTAFVWDPVSFYVIRFLLGVAEAGLFPGIVLYLTYWFPKQQRAKAVGVFMASIPVSVIIGGPLSGWLLTQGGVLGLEGWQLIFVVQGVPAVILGIVCFFVLPDRPSSVTWLTTQEKETLNAVLQQEAAEDAVQTKGRVRDTFKNRYVWMFTIMYFCYACGSYGVSLFLPQILAGFKLNDQTVGLLAAVPYAVGLVVMILVAISSDRLGERRFHFGVPMLVAGIGLLVAGLTLSVPVLSFLFMILGVSGLMSSVATFWPRPNSLLMGTVAVAGIAVINSVGNIGGFVGPYAVGLLTDLTHGSFTAGLLFLTGLCLLGGILALLIRRNAHDSRREVRREGGVGEESL